MSIGRPPLPDGERKDVTFRIRMTADERAVLEKAAQSAGTNASDWSRTVLLRAAKRTTRG